ncbi:MAG: sulfotransferase [Candidatus Thorarchaeota archaeon]
MKQPIFILGPHKSGTTLLRNLLDGTPGLFVVPHEMHFFQYANDWVDYRLRMSRPPRLSFEDTKKAYYKSMERTNRPETEMGGSDIARQIDLERFQQKLSEPVNSFSQLISLYVAASYEALMGSEMPTGSRVVEKSVEHAEFAVQLKSLFPDAKFIHILRNPYSNLVSLRRYLSRNRKKFPFLGPALSSLENSYYHMYHNSDVLRESYLVVKYEDLLTSTEEKMREIASFLNLEFHPAMLVPTTLGRDWKGNSSRGLQFSGVSTKNLEIWKEEISHLEVFYVNQLFGYIMAKFEYERLDMDRPFKWPVSKERPKSYILNRLLKYYQ